MKKKFVELCAKSDLLIKKYQNNFYISISPSLHILREHPVDLKKYKYVLESKKILIIIHLIKFFFIYLIKAFTNFCKKKYCYIKVDGKEYKQYSNIFVSHLNYLDQCLSKDDFYFKNMPLISSKHVNTLVVLINHTPVDLSQHLQRFTQRNYDIIILSNNLEYKDKIHIFIKCLKSFYVILYDILFNLRNFKQLIMLNVLSCIFRDNTQLCFRFFTQINKILYTYKPNNIFFTCEGYAWEKALCAAVRKYSKSAKCIGYQHSRLFKYQHSMKREFKNNFDPHIILTSGKYAYEELKPKLSGLKVINIGKHHIENITSVDSHKLSSFNSKSKIYVCVLPDAFPDEAIKLLQFSLSCALQFKNIFFIWRFHPATNLKQVNKIINLKGNLPDNVIISKQDLYEDLKISQMALYRGSTTILSAMQMGIIPIYFKTKNEFDIDILDRSYEWGIKIESSINLIKQIQNITKSKEKLLKSQRSAILYSKNYFSLFNERRFEQLFCNNES